MSEIDKLAKKNNNIAIFAESYFQNLIDTFKKIDKKSILKLEMCYTIETCRLNVMRFLLLSCFF